MPYEELEPGQEPITPDPEPDPEPEPEPDPFTGLTRDELIAELTRSKDGTKQARKDAAKYRRQARDLEAETAKEKRERELAELEEVDRLKVLVEEADQRAVAAESSAKTARIQNAVVAEAGNKGFAHPGDVAKLLDLTDIPVSESGDVDKNAVIVALDELASDKPEYLRAQEEDDTPPANRFGPSAPGGTPIIRRKRGLDPTIQAAQDADKLREQGDITPVESLKRKVAGALSRGADKGG
jgi:hypothetical protein